MVEVKLLVCGVEVHILFDPGSTHSFISPMFVKMIDAPHSQLVYILIVITTGLHFDCYKTSR